MVRTLTTPHRLVNPPNLPPPVGFSHAVVGAPGRTVYIAGQIASSADGKIVETTLPAQLDVALGNVVHAVAAVGGLPADVVSMQLFTTAMVEYRSSLKEIGRVYRRHFGRHFPAMTLIGVTELVEPAAMVEVSATVVIAARASDTGH